MPDGFDITQRPGGGPPAGGSPGGGPPMGRPPMGRPPMGRPPMGRPPFRRPRRRPIFPVFPVFPPGRCAFIDRFGRCCDRFGRCCDRFGRCSFSDFYGGYPLTGFADIDDISYGVGWDRIDDDGAYGDLGLAVFNDMDSDWDDQY